MFLDILIIAIKIILGISWLLTLTLILTWVERKESAVVQDRIGANRASILGLRVFGLFQPIADAIKMMFKEDFVPPFSNRFLHTIAPFLSFFFAVITLAAIPFGDEITIGSKVIALQIVRMNVGLVFILAMFSLGIYGIIIGGWASNNKYTLLGGMRGTAQIISYEIALGLSLIGLIMIYPSLELNEIVKYQGSLLFGFIPKWGVILQPLGFFIFLIAGMAETKRVPFDLPEGESEIIGFYTEYSGMKFGLFMMTDFVEVILISALVTTLFFGGWQVPYLYPDGFHFPWGGNILLNKWIVTVLQVLSFNLKVAFFCWLLVLARWTFPRYRYDQLMNLGWKLLIPMSFVNIIGTGLILILV
ncbi:NADH-quinone oxidoreductase subunit NuoH [Candidatus Aminicenantes bacterium AC-708-M15]|jgi:NADH-quinone oxidoreductase subunit H|nr:NADH-quinone oxidoreductase subunit NuoH [SCandidatus Aminicenantes bacterium Aminicenantia_JdfR_composite]MCP2596750.1 NADH-quinone oxidoreductase subunit NuoH [Candidatus Aminicenantes bacterium AC-335-G13]MCP2604410.1 NADH-quinone oxidoreductase subunit NuoH [Candidatus Aminicenantes bacterium AC-708-M15]MCP2619256.1 NADH-quinone oxidoreductase subunit NuoH [Candidatus Aminicenantes bacterium AC-335-K20]MCP2620442.1 NADH-quinone oxidoreductase subunit NuoH [Candidatus Aminicenantes bacter